MFLRNADEHPRKTSAALRGAQRVLQTGSGVVGFTAQGIDFARRDQNEMVEHEGIAPSTPIWKTGVFLSTPMLVNGIPCWSCTSVDCSADSCLAAWLTGWKL